MARVAVEERAAFADAAVLLGAVLTAALGLLLVLASHDAGMAFHGLLFAVAGLLAAIYILQWSFDKQRPLDAGGGAEPYFMDGPIRVATIAAVFWGIAGFVVG